ncbi:transposase [Agrobacterium tumefaciens]|nr:transposase [Agrobacterium radiobacter]MBB5588931.1 transposase [Agrobacterium radiobacter]
MILELHQQGLTMSAIYRETGIDRKTVRKYIERGLEVPAYGPRKPRATVIDPFASYLRERVPARRPGRRQSILPTRERPI